MAERSIRGKIKASLERFAGFISTEKKIVDTATQMYLDQEKGYMSYVVELEAEVQQGLKDISKPTSETYNRVMQEQTRLGINRLRKELEPIYCETENLLLSSIRDPQRRLQVILDIRNKGKEFWQDILDNPSDNEKRVVFLAGFRLNQISEEIRQLMDSGN